MPLPPLVEPVAALSDAETARTARHRTLAGLGDIGQRRLAAAHVAVVGAGGLGSPVVLALAGAGIGSITVIDDDEVEHSNLHRQVMHRHADVGSPKVDSATRVTADLSPETVVHAVRERLTPDNADRLLAGAHVVIDGTDTFETRSAVADACERLGTPLVWGVLQEFHAQVTVFWSTPPAGHPAVRLADLYPPDSVGEVPTCAQVGVLGALCLQVGGIMAIEALKLLAGIGEPLLGRVLVIDALRSRQLEVPLRPTTATETPTTKTPSAVPMLTAEQTRAAQDAGATLLDVREPFETATGVIPGSLLIPLDALLANPAHALPDPTARVIVVCAVGFRAQRAAAALRLAGIDASVLAGGLAEWRFETVPA
ncbi:MULTISPECIES: ThiF family adenylyltransferase [unclassified Microbacterium]|uniref:ThiF family adenylyltransferase n=1 Tax=unclassified Microbacterium TaxID=2609290 RepID=UPI00214A9884|nr:MULTISPECIES: ThiF family adenylyltransferase [unclassified Microbacterium]MCR2783845.1 ThiF family adenylyltransferase [Microbacterium sp. zg.B96]WIM15307.1 ThiF family adenylyltransferase [Microbacterium sp. zg-B96]